MQKDCPGHGPRSGILPSVRKRHPVEKVVPPETPNSDILLTSISLSSLCQGIQYRHQGVYANIVTNDADSSDIKIFVGSAAGPYKQPLNDRRRDRACTLEI